MIIINGSLILKCFLSHGGILKNAEILRAMNDPVGPQSSESMAE